MILTVEIELEKDTGKFASKEDLTAAIESELSSLNVEDTVYNVVNVTLHACPNKRYGS